MKEMLKTKRDIARELARKYSTMTHDEFDILESVLVQMKFAKGDMILKEGEVCKNIYYIEKGLVRQFYFKKGKDVTEHMAPEGEVIMCIESLFKEEPTRLQVEALEPVLMYALPKARLEEVALHNVNIQILYRKILEESLINSQIHADLVRFETAQDRYRKAVQTISTTDVACPSGIHCQLSSDDSGDFKPCKVKHHIERIM